MPRFLILLGSALILPVFALGCGGEADITVAVEMEKMLDRADRLKEQMSLKGPIFSEEDFNRLVGAYLAIRNRIQPPSDDAAVESASDEKRDAWALASLASTRIGMLYLQRRSYKQAFDYFKAVADNPATSHNQRTVVISKMASIKEMAREFEEAAVLYDSLAIRYKNMINPQSPDFDLLTAPIKSAQMWRQAGNYRKFDEQMDKARIYYNELLSKYADTPTRPAALGKLIATYIQQDRFTEAIKLMKSTKDYSTGRVGPNLLLMIADIYMNNLSDLKNAEKTFRELITFYPTHRNAGRAQLGLARILYSRKRYAEARKAVSDIEKIPNIDEGAVAEAYYLTALCFEKEQRWERAIGQFDRLRATFPGSDKAFEAVLYIANRYRGLGEDELARRSFGEAEKYFKKYSGGDISNTTIAARAQNYLAKAYLDQDDYEKAVEALLELYKRYPNEAEGRIAPLRLSKLYESALYDTTQAIFWLKVYAANNPGAGNIEKVLAQIKLLESQ